MCDIIMNKKIIGINAMKSDVLKVDTQIHYVLKVSALSDPVN